MIRTDKLDTGPARVYLKERKTGTVATAGTTALTGTGTKFLAELEVGEEIWVEGEATSRIVATVTSDTAATVTVAFATTASAKTLDGNAHVGGLIDGVTLTEETSVLPVTVDELGSSTVDEIVTGKNVKVKLRFREIRLENFKRAMAEATNIIVNVTKRRFESTTSAGLSLLSIAKELTIKPIIGNVETTDLEKIIVFPFAAPSAETRNLVFAVSENRAIDASFTAFPDPKIRNRIWYIGDRTA